MTRVAVSPTNYFIRSDAFQNAAWAKGETTPTDATADVTAPDGSSTATKVVETVANTPHYLAPNASPVTVVDGQIWQTSFWIRGGGTLTSTRRVLWLWNDATGSSYVCFNPRTGLVDATGSARVSGIIYAEPQDTSWYRCTALLLSVVAGQEANVAQGFLELDNGADGAGISPSYVGTVTAGIYLAGMTSSPGGHPAIYTRTTNAAVVGNPRGLAAYP